MSLQRVLGDMMALRPERNRRLLEDLTARLRETALAGVLKPGDPMPEFVLPDTEGGLFYSGDRLAQGPLVVVFFRGDWCPFCVTTLRALDEVVSEIRAAGGDLVALTPDVSGFANAVWRNWRPRFPVLSDVDSAVGLQFGAMFRVPKGLHDFYVESGVNLTVRNGDDSLFLPMPSTFIADRDGIVRYSHASGDITDRAEPDVIAAKVRALSAGGEP